VPCDTISLSKVSFSLSNTDVEILSTALENLGYKVTMKKGVLHFTSQGYDYVEGTFENGQFNVTLDARKKFDIDAIKRAYSREVVRITAKRFGWTLSEESEGVYEARRRF
jgi:hypothetical protein